MISGCKIKYRELQMQGRPVITVKIKKKEYAGGAQYAVR